MQTHFLHVNFSFSVEVHVFQSLGYSLFFFLQKIRFNLFLSFSKIEKNSFDILSALTDKYSEHPFTVQVHLGCPFLGTTKLLSSETVAIKKTRLSSWYYVHCFRSLLFSFCLCCSLTRFFFSLPAKKRVVHDDGRFLVCLLSLPLGSTKLKCGELREQLDVVFFFTLRELTPAQFHNTR